MLIYLDAKDLINIFEKSSPCTADQFENILRQGKHRLALSVTTIMELSEPLLHKQAKTNVMGLLNRIERLPHVFIHSSIPSLELQEAIKAFSKGVEYKNVSPFVDRFDKTLDLNANPPTNDAMAELLAWADWRFQWIHPFKDFNGRIGRILLAVLLYKLALPHMETAPLEPDVRHRYLNALRVADRGNIGPLKEMWLWRIAKAL